jgi:hypothetical protein
LARLSFLNDRPILDSLHFDLCGHHLDKVGCLQGSPSGWLIPSLLNDAVSRYPHVHFKSPVSGSTGILYGLGEHDNDLCRIRNNNFGCLPTMMHRSFRSPTLVLHSQLYWRLNSNRGDETFHFICTKLVWTHGLKYVHEALEEPLPPHS